MGGSWESVADRTKSAESPSEKEGREVTFGLGTGVLSTRGVSGRGGPSCRTDRQEVRVEVGSYARGSRQ